MYENLNKLTLITSESCNLNCSYCEIAKNSNHQSHLEETLKIKQALSSGSYITKVIQGFRKHGIDVSNITTIELWGQEPTLTLDEFSTQIPRLLDWAINAKRSFFSTNGVAYPERIINYINIINNYLKDHKNRKFNAAIQFSFDGFDETLEKRGVEPQEIIDNIKTVITTVNDIKIVKNFKISFVFHGVLTMDIIKQGTIGNNFESHWIEIDRLVKNFVELNINPQVKIDDFLVTGIQNPYNATSDEGKLFADYLKKCLNTNSDFQSSFIHVQAPFRIAAKAIKAFSENSLGDIDNNIIKNFNYYYDPVLNDTIGTITSCGTGNLDLKIRYDGTILYCQNLFFSLSLNDLEDKIGSRYDIQRAALSYNHIYPNLLTSDKKDIEHFIDLLNGQKHYIYNFMVSSIVNLMYILLQNHQIDDSYQDDHKKILRHAHYMAMFLLCFYNNLLDTGSLYTITFGTIRFYCNGALDYLEEYLNTYDEVIPLWN